MSGTSRSSKVQTGFDFRIDEQQTDFDIRFYGAILDRNGRHVDALRQLVDLVADRGDYQRALELDQRLVELRPHDCLAKYTLACSLSVLGHVGAALKTLEEAIELGYDDIAHLEADGDLDAVRRHPGYLCLLEQLGYSYD